MGVHGNGLTNMIGMKPSRFVVEFFPPATIHYDYCMLAEIFRLGYYGMEGSEEGFIIRGGCRIGAVRGKVNQKIKRLPLECFEVLGDVIRSVRA
jgi:hypothetical protein